MTVKELIIKLNELAETYGESTEVKMYDTYEANEGWGDYPEWDVPNIYYNPTDSFIALDFEP